MGVGGRELGSIGGMGQGKELGSMEAGGRERS